MEHKKGLQMKTVIEGLFISSIVLIAVVALGIFKIAEVWPATIALIFFFESKAKMDNIKNIFLGGAMGIFLAYAMIQCVIFLGPIVMNAELALLIPLFVIVFLIVALGEVVHPFFNNYTFCYFTVALITGAKQTPVTSLISLAVGGGFLVAMGVLMVRMIVKHATKKAHSAGA